LQCNIFFIQSIQFAILFAAAEENTVIYSSHSSYFDTDDQKHANKSTKNAGSWKQGPQTLLNKEICVS
jgi:hypothetical protein